MREDQIHSLLEEFELPRNTFTKQELENTGAKIEHISYASFRKVVAFRKLLDSPVYFIKNGITTGKHKSKGHPNGHAFDVRVPKKAFYKVFKCAIQAGLLKFGGYWNGNTYSYHVENGPIAFWKGKKKTAGKGSWEFSQLIIDPKS